ncbi:hypothetical protein J2Y38_004702 [Flavobacterium sp. 2755]|uniref:hypothetical protein n=1 Tax=Flavobacterium sp. 2755 TaxID=2817765 RepID=UPI002856824E|nr:hypothetical protein [Flavobacterium sp. 2755]MDR6764469.1 hypothetical protein [Flavobacterium sp. 2755]
MAYFYSEIFKDKIKDSYYTIEMVKGFLDANNLTQYTAIHEIDVKYYKLNDAFLFKHCWLIIQCAWFFNSEHFGHHQHIDYLNHYIETGRKLPTQEYKYDPIYLDKKYNDIEKSIKKKTINGFTLVSQWYYSILLLVCKELKLSVTHFNCNINDNREFSSLPQTSRQLRSLTPFKLIECDIKSAFPTFLDIETGSNLKDLVYNNLMKAKSITRGEAKILFNKMCNSGNYKSKEQTTEFFLSCGYTAEQCAIILELTHHPTIKFYSFMTEQESNAIKNFIFINNLQRATRLHDAVLFIDDKVKPTILKIEPNCDFGYKELNRPAYKESFGLSDKRIPYEYISSIPQGLTLIDRTEPTKKGEVKGEANGFKFYNDKFPYTSAGFNLNDYQTTYLQFLRRLHAMLSTLQCLNRRKTNRDTVYKILQHIRANSQYIFNVKSVYLRVIKFKYNPALILIKERNYTITEQMSFKKRGDFNKAKYDALKKVNNQNNFKELFCLIEERITIEDYNYINPINQNGARKNNLLVFAIIQKFNLLCTGLQRARRKQVKNETLYNTSIKSILFKSLSLKQQQQNAFLKKKIKAYEKSLIKFNELVNNRIITKQLLLILCDISGQATELEIKRDLEVIKNLKADLIKSVSDKNFDSVEAGAIEFDLRYMTILKQEIVPISNLSNVFDTDISKSIFNNTTIEDAYSRGEVFFKEYCNFHKIDFKEKLVLKQVKPKGKFSFPQLDFPLD